MEILKKKAAVPGKPVIETPPAAGRAPAAYTVRTTKQSGDAAEDRALAHLQAAGLRMVTRNYRTPGRGGGEIDLVLRERDGTLVFVEVRSRRTASHGGAAASVSFAKRRRIIFAARSYLSRLPALPSCRFDVVSVEGERIEWLKAAFDAA